MPAPGNEIEAVAGRLATAATSLYTLIADRSYPGKPAGNASLPYVVFYRASGGDGTTLGGPRGTRQTDIRVDAYARSEEDAEAVLAAVRSQLDGWRDRPNGVQGCFAQGDADEEILDDDRHVSGQTFSLWFNPQ